MRILISGGGLAGLTLAYWLHHYGFTPIVIEKADGLRRAGYGIDFVGTGYDVAEKMGILPVLQQQQLPVEKLIYVDKTGKQTAELNIQIMRDALNGRYMGLMHPTLEETLYAAIQNHVEVRFATSLTAVHQTPTCVTVTFSDGTTDSFDLLIGADGIHSHTRSLVFGPEPQFSHHLGYRVAAFALPDRYGIGNTWSNYLEPGRMVGAYCSNQPDQIMAAFIYQTPETAYISPAQRLPALKTAYAGMGWLAAPFLAAAPDPDDIFMDTVTQIRMPRWSNGRICLVGDACGCMTLISGQGASMAMGGAAILAQFLAQAPDYTQAFDRYEAWLRPHIEYRQKRAIGSAKTFVPSNHLSIALQTAVFRFIGQKIFARLIKQQFAMETVLPDSFQAIR